MNPATSLLPLVTATLNTAVENVGAVFQDGRKFLDVLRSPSSDVVNTGEGVGQSDNTPQSSELAQQLQRDTLRQSFETLRDSIHKQLVERFTEHGIDLDEPAVLTVDADGRVLETGGHWDRAKIEELIASDPGLRAGISQLLQQGQALSDGGSLGFEPGVRDAPRLVVGEKELFFQVV